MYLLKNIVTMEIITCFPLLLYIIYVAHQKNMNEDESTILLDFTLLAALLLTFWYCGGGCDNFSVLFTLTPLLFAYIFKRKLTAIFMSVIILENTYFITGYNFFVLIILISLFYIINYFHEKNLRNFIVYSNIFCFCCIIFYLVSNLHNNVVYLIASVSIYYIATTLSVLLVKKSFEILNLFSTLKDFEHEKQIKVSLFKITHEIKNPIAVVKGYLDMFNVEDVNKSTKYIAIMKQEINRTLNLLSDFMQFTKISLKKQVVDADFLIDDVKNTVIPFFNSNNINYSFDLEENIELFIDYNRMKQVIVNIIKNSVEACETDGVINTSMFKDKKNIYIIVKDNGCGMSKETLENMLTPFYTTKSFGTGIGVSLSREIVHAHGGSIDYNSVLNKGTTVKIVLPIN